MSFLLLIKLLLFICRPQYNYIGGQRKNCFSCSCFEIGAICQTLNLRVLMCKMEEINIYFKGLLGMKVKHLS